MKLKIRFSFSTERFSFMTFFMRAIIGAVAHSVLETDLISIKISQIVFSFLAPSSSDIKLSSLLLSSLCMLTQFMLYRSNSTESISSLAFGERYFTILASVINYFTRNNIFFGNFSVKNFSCVLICGINRLLKI